MSTKTPRPTIEDGIKTALDAADTAITVTGEFEKIRADYDLTRAEVKTVNRQIRTVFFSALAASGVAILAAGLIYFRTMSEMQTSNQTSLEALVIFAENVDKLAAATTAIQDHESNLADIQAAVQAMSERVATMETAIVGMKGDLLNGVSAANTEQVGLISQTASSVIEDLKADNQAQAEALTGHINDIGDKIAAALSPGEAEVPGSANPMMAEINANLQTIMMLQKEISAKLTVAQTKVAKPAPVKKPAPPKPNDIIKYP